MLIIDGYVILSGYKVRPEDSHHFGTSHVMAINALKYLFLSIIPQL